MGPAELCPDPAEPGHDVLHLAEVVGAKLDSSDVGVLAARYNVLQQLPLAALAVNVQQVHCPVEKYGFVFYFFRCFPNLQFFILLIQILEFTIPNVPWPAWSDSASLTTLRGITHKHKGNIDVKV